MFDPPAVQYPHFCMWPDKVHDHFRDGLYHSPLSYVASRYCTALTVLYCTVLYCTVLNCTVLYCTVLYCTVLYRVTEDGCPGSLAGGG